MARVLKLANTYKRMGIQRQNLDNKCYNKLSINHDVWLVESFVIMSDRTAVSTTQAANLRLRIITASVFLPVAVAASLFGGFIFLSFTLPVMCIGMLEFYVMEKDTRMQGSSLTGIPTGIAIALGFYFRHDWLWQTALASCIVLTLLLEIYRRPTGFVRALAQVGTTLCGIIYISFPTAFLLSLRNMQPDGLMWLFVVFAITWGTDSFAYVVGRFFGKTKLAPLISPNKTVEGAIGGILGAWIPAFGILIVAGAFEPTLIPMIVAGPFIAVSGDLFESALKRTFRVKDSFVEGLNLFPGHGGVLDRIDALLWVTTWVFLYLLVIGIV